MRAFFYTLSNKQGIRFKWHGWYLFYALIIAILLNSSCQNAEQKAKEKAIKDSTAAASLLPASVELSKAETERLHNACEKWYDSVLLLRGFNGGMLVAKNGNIVFEKYTGTAHLPGNDLITETTPLHIASVSKTFTAMSILKLWQDGKLNIDDTFSKYIPRFNYPGVTIRCLLNHRSGLPNYLYFMESLGWDKKIPIRNEDVLNYLIDKKAYITNISSPNTHFTYCNTNYALLALLIEQVTGKKYADYLQETIFTPLGMKNTFVFDSTKITEAAPSYDWRGGLIPLAYLDMVYGDKNIYTTPRDLLIWDRTLTAHILLTPQTLEQAYAPYSNERAGTRNYGLGWRMNIYPDGKKMIYHNGWWHGSNASFIRLLKEDATIIVIGNKYNRNIYHAKMLCDIFGNYYNGEEEEENDSSKSTDSLHTVPVFNNTTAPPALSKKDARLRELLKDKNKVNTPARRGQ
jgi:CubicO group peptidase (beta-lactamase class C family)